MTPQLHAVDEEIESYPISVNDRLDSHFFVQWNLVRWEASDFRRMAYRDPEVGFFGIELFFKARGETPVGTLPCCDEALAFMLHLPLERWRDLTNRRLSPLHGWRRVLCDNGEVRLAHAVVTEVVKEALKSRKRNVAKLEDDRMRKRMNTIRAHLNALPGAERYAKDEVLLGKINIWIETEHPGGSATLNRVRDALNALSRPR